MFGNKKMIKKLLFKLVVIMEANLLVYARIAEKKSHLVNLDTENMGDGNIRNQSWCKSCR